MNWHIEAQKMAAQIPEKLSDAVQGSKKIVTWIGRQITQLSEKAITAGNMAGQKMWKMAKKVATVSKPYLQLLLSTAVVHKELVAAAAAGVVVGITLCALARFFCSSASEGEPHLQLLS